MHDIAQRSLASQDKWELEQLLLEVEKIHPKVIVEIGVHLGGGMRVLKEAFDPKYMIGLEQDTCYEYPELTVLTGVDSHKEETKSKLIGALSDMGKIDYMMIDGDHSYQGVQLDFYMYKDLVRKGGIIAFHDIGVINNDSCHVKEFWNDIKGRYSYKEILNPEKGIGTGVGILFL